MAGHDQESERKTRHRLHDCICNHVKSLVTLLMIFAMVFCIIMIVMVHKWRWESNVAEHIQGCIDVAVIGAGVSGSYAAYRLREHNLKVVVFEATDRIGGKLFTKMLPGSPEINIELGADHYFPAEHLLLNQSIHALKLRQLAFPPPSRDPPTYFLRDLRLREAEIKDATKITAVYNLRNHEKARSPRDLINYYMLKALANTSYWVNKPLTAITKSGEPLYQQGLQNILGDIASREGLALLADTLPWRGFLANENAASLGAILLAGAGGGARRATATLEGGMNTLPTALMDKFLNASSEHELRKNRRLACIKKMKGQVVYNLILQWTKTADGVTKDTKAHSEVCARDVILAMPGEALQTLDWKPLEKDAALRENLASVTSDPALVAYFTYSTRWWKSDPRGEMITDLPVRRVRYVGSHLSPSGAPEYVFQVAVADATDVEYFAGLLDRRYYDGRVVYRCHNATYFVADVHAQLAELFYIEKGDIPQPDQVIVQRWSGPIAGGWTLWRRGVHWERVERRMARPVRGDSVYVVGNTFQGADSQVTIEGALRSVDNMLRDFFRKTPPA